MSDDRGCARTTNRGCERNQRRCRLPRGFRDVIVRTEERERSANRRLVGLEIWLTDMVGSLTRASRKRLRWKTASGAGGFSQLKLCKKKRDLCLWFCSVDRSSSRDRRGCRGWYLSASSQYGGLPSLATAKERRTKGQFTVANSPNVQRAHHYWLFTSSSC